LMRADRAPARATMAATAGGNGRRSATHGCFEIDGLDRPPVRAGQRDAHYASREFTFAPGLLAPGPRPPSGPLDLAFLIYLQIGLSIIELAYALLVSTCTHTTLG
jgi:hypothetical protein